MAKFNPDEHTVQEVNDHIAKHPDQADAIYAAEESGKARTTILNNREADAQGESRDATMETTTGVAATQRSGLSQEDLERRGLRLPESPA